MFVLADISVMSLLIIVLVVVLIIYVIQRLR